MAGFHWVDMVLLGAALVSVLSLGMAGVCLTLLRKQAAVHDESQQRLQRELKVTQSSAVGMGKRLLLLEQQLAAGATTQTPAARTPSAAMADNLKDAVSLLNAGLAVEEVARRCGISKAEASLMKLMQSQVHRGEAA